MKKLMFLFLMSICIISCNQGSGNKSNETEDQSIEGQNTEEATDLLTVSQTDLALNFINEYVHFLNNYDENISLSYWVNSSKLVTEDFKKELTKMIDEANEEDPEWGLGFDPILDAQDNPDGFELLSFDPTTNLIELKGKEWEDFEVTVKTKFVNGEWLVDGCGAVNVPEEDRSER